MSMDEIRALCHRPGPFVSIALDVDSGREDALDQVRIGWKDLRQELERDGAPPHQLEPFEEVLGVPPDRARTILAVIDGEGRMITRFAAEPVGRSIASFAPVPRLGPLLSDAMSSIPHVIVVSDRTGADIVTVVDGEEDHEQVDGDTEPIHRSNPGGWSQRRYQQRVE